ncbi:hypothetical protein [Micromonospora carbonacea]|uniref:hypothetical protein n=1 Tax=Micromonospora carbonacea TaxID=47853 RepID=UPI003D73430F
MTNYPVPYHDGDQRLDDDLLDEVRAALTKRGFPELTRVDYGMLEIMLVRFVYAERRAVSVTLAPR